MSEESMVERVAKAMVAAIDDDEAYVKNDFGLDDVVVDGNVNFLTLARAAVEEMREPTMDMMYRGGGRTAGNMSIAANAYREMIDTALKENA